MQRLSSAVLYWRRSELRTVPSVWGPRDGYGVVFESVATTSPGRQYRRASSEFILAHNPALERQSCVQDRPDWILRRRQVVSSPVMDNFASRYGILPRHPTSGLVYSASGNCTARSTKHRPQQIREAITCEDDTMLGYLAGILRVLDGESRSVLRWQRLAVLIKKCVSVPKIPVLVSVLDPMVTALLAPCFWTPVLAQLLPDVLP